MKLEDYKRVFSITHKPDRNEFKTIVSVTGIGIIIIGLIGFILTIAKELFFK